MAQITQLSNICIPGRLHSFTAKTPSTDEVIIDLPADVWTVVLSNVTFRGQVFILDLVIEPTAYLIAVVDRGDPAPLLTFEGGIKFDTSFSPASDVASDFYVMAETNPGKVAVLT